MCGIFTAIGGDLGLEDLMPYFQRIEHRGPDHSSIEEIEGNIFFGFHRLAINGLTPSGNQPMKLESCVLVANAEIFNYRELADEFGIELTTGSDCEILIRLYRKIGLEAMLKRLDGEFAFVLYDHRSGEIMAARDHLGIRGMYFGKRDNGGFYMASESKALTFCDHLQQFPPGHFWRISKPNVFFAHYDHNYPIHGDDEDTIIRNIRELFTASVKNRMMSEQPIGCLLSGGLDSSLVASIVAAEYAKEGKNLETFSIGLKGSPDLAAAEKVATHIGSKHHQLELQEQDFLDVLEETVYMLGSYDVTTVRASVGHMLISRYVRQQSDIKVLFSGETADEFGSYLYFQNAPDPASFQEEAIRLLRDIHFFDMKRGDRSISWSSLEARVPFADKKFMQYYLGIDPALRMFDEHRIEKYLIRKAFEKEDLLPADVLWRRKNGFSDSVSSMTRSWSEIIREHVDRLISDREFMTEAEKFSPNPPKTKEAYYYRKVFTHHYGKHQNLTPYQWLPKWCGDVVDPSARVLSIYQAD